MRVPSTTMAPSRMDAVGFGIAVKLTVAAPRPVEGVTLVIHSEALDAVHEQSGVAETAIVPVPPPGARLSAGGVALTEHFVDDGLSDVEVLAPQADTSTAVSRAGTNVWSEE